MKLDEHMAKKADGKKHRLTRAGLPDDGRTFELEIQKGKRPTMIITHLDGTIEETFWIPTKQDMESDWT